ncbi:MAG: hypothetical protein LBN26_02385 [Christensenellaceae bacterium]|nr:hypothetical protein [Christensenellaceae bacterium]
MHHQEEQPLCWDDIARLKNEAAQRQERLNAKCIKALAESGSLADEDLCHESTELEIFMLRIHDLETRLQQLEEDK